MGKKKHYYAVRKGRKVGIFSSWNECQGYVLGFKDARFKGFQTREEAEDYMKNGSGSSKKNRKESEPKAKGAALPVKKQPAAVNRIRQQRLDLLPVEPALPSQEALRTLRVNGKDCAPDDLFAYVGVSFDKEKQMTGYGVVLAQDGDILFRDMGALDYGEESSNRNLAAEACGIQKAVELAIANNFAEIYIIHQHLEINRNEAGEWGPSPAAGEAFRERMAHYGQVVELTYVQTDRSPFHDMAQFLAEKAAMIA